MSTTPDPPARGPREPKKIKRWSDLTDEEQHWADLSIDSALDDYQATGDLSGIIYAIRLGKADQQMLDAAAAELEKLSRDKKHATKVKNAAAKAARYRDIEAIANKGEENEIKMFSSREFLNKSTVEVVQILAERHEVSDRTIWSIMAAIKG